MPLLLLQSDPAAWTVLPGKTAIGINGAGQLCLKQPDGTVTILTSSGPSSSAQNNTAGTTTVTPSQPVHSAEVTLLGTSIRTAVIALSTVSPIDSATIDLTALVENDVAGITIEVRDSDAGGELLATFTTGGDAVVTAFWSFVYRSGQWNLKQAQIPAF